MLFKALISCHGDWSMGITGYDCKKEGRKVMGDGGEKFILIFGGDGG